MEEMLDVVLKQNHMTKDDIIKQLIAKGYNNDASATQQDLYTIIKRGQLFSNSNRLNSGWARGKYLIAYIDDTNKDEKEYVSQWLSKVSKYKDQFLCLETENNNWVFYDYTGSVVNFNVNPPQIKSANNNSKEITNIHTSTLQQIYYGAPGTGKSHEVKRLTGESKNKEEVDLPNVFRTTFHPDTDYASFVGCYKPTMKPTSKEEKTLTGKDEEIVYEFVPQVFADAYIYAYNNPTTPTYLVIEEINRGNCAQIFGDLFQLLDRNGGVSEYKIKADKDLAKYLKEAKDENGKDVLTDKEGIKDGKLCLPANLHILATMNTSDQSLFPMDSAFKRRWEWEYVPINYDKNIESGKFEITIGEKTDERKYSWVGFIEKVNEKIFDLTQSEDKQMGNFFIKQSIDEKGFNSKVMFYLWYEVLRDETENNKYFFHTKKLLMGKKQ